MDQQYFYLYQYSCFSSSLFLLRVFFLWTFVYTNLISIHISVVSYWIKITKKSDNPICYLNYSIKVFSRYYFIIVFRIKICLNQWWLHIYFRVVTEPPSLAKNLYWEFKKYIYTKLIYIDHPNNNIEHFVLRITRMWVQ